MTKSDFLENSQVIKENRGRAEQGRGRENYDNSQRFAEKSR